MSGSRPRHCWRGPATRWSLIYIWALDAPLDRLAGEVLRVRGVTGDVACEPFAHAFAQRIAVDYGAADILVHNAGISLTCPAEDTTAA